MNLEWNTVYQGDNLLLMQQMADQGLTFNLVLTDPPYNLGKDFGNDTDDLPEEEFFGAMDKRLALIEKLLSPNGSVIWFCTHRYVGQTQFALRKYLRQRRMMIWYYENGLSRQTKEPVTEFDPFWWFSKTDSYVYNLDESRVPYKSDRVKNPVYKKDASGQKRAWTPNPKGRKRGDVWAYPTLAGKRFEDERTDHPTQKPSSLIIDLIRSYCPINADGYYEGRILDPYMGSGTTAYCCEKLNKTGGHKIRWMGCELEQKWVDVCNHRIRAEHDRTDDIDIFME